MKGNRRHLPTVAWLALMAPVALALWAAGSGLESLLVPYYFRIILLSGIAVIAAVSLNIVNGFTGQFSIGHAGFMLVGAYASAGITMFARPFTESVLRSAHVPDVMLMPLQFAAAIAVAALAASIVGLLVGLPSLRLRGDYLAIATLGFGEGIRAIFVTVDAVGGASGLHNIPPLTSFVWVFLGVVGVIITARNLAASTHGRALFAIREDELAAQAVGIDTFRYKVLAFLISAAWAGVAGALLAHLDLGIDPRSYSFMKSVEIVVMVVLGGLGSVTGSVIAAVGLTWLPEILRPVAEYRMVFYSALLVLLMLLRPRGLFGRKELGLADLLGKKKTVPNANRKEGG
ncbi:MAG: branched-chain amino acid ABC transporter permease [Armatimonadetes bacterium]|nr:branched-chain amino acid ABC transporter permease [Armatimonadota bacterium]